MQYQIKFELGDWSGDGHEISDSTIVNCNLPVEELRELHFKFEEVYGFDIGNLCSEYGKSWLDSEQFESLLLLGILTMEDRKNLDEDDRYYIEDPQDLLIIWLECLKVMNSEFEYSLPTSSSLPSMHFGGYDSKGRHLHTPGYGLFE